MRLPGSQTKRLRQSSTVVSIGASEGYPMRGTDGIVNVCCAEGWVAEYSRRVRAMIRTYRRDGRGRVVWLTLPIPKGPREVADAVNAAIVRAATGIDGVSVLRFDLLFSPVGFQEVIRYRGRDVRVREPDGIHLNIAGAAIAAKLVATELRRD